MLVVEAFDDFSLQTFVIISIFYYDPAVLDTERLLPQFFGEVAQTETYSKDISIGCSPLPYHCCTNAFYDLSLKEYNVI